MLETKQLVKIYKPKKGVPVKALDGITLKFPDKGMVFLLGKSGSGKSTLLNVLGGLDRYNSGEILIKGVSSRKFKQSDFDSYRNTYVGFIFQEYNILDEFSVGANVALALHLQGKKATDEAINGILNEVDLAGYGNRKPNELSGGQKQRVAIARALVKNPEIIMADEPTGALDSATGRQVLETLKKLSAEKLVIVVSHDREFAEKYADRIIELADGKVIADVERTAEEFTPEAVGLTYEEGTVSVPEGYRLTEEDRIAINQYLENYGKGITITAKEMQSHKSFRATDQKTVTQKGGAFHPIKSRLPLKYAFPMGASGLKHKKVRLVFTVLLSVVAFTLFGLADTFGAYNHIKTTVNSLIDSEVSYASVQKNVAIKDENGEIYYYNRGRLSATDLKTLQRETGVALEGVYHYGYETPNFETNLGPTEKHSMLYRSDTSGYVEITQDLLDRMGASLVAGTLPDGAKKEIAVSEYVYKLFEKRGYVKSWLWEDGTEDKFNAENYKPGMENFYPSDSETEPIKNYQDLLGKTVTLQEENYVITAIVDTGLDWDRYQVLDEDMDKLSNAEMLLYYALSQEFEFALQNNLTGTVMVGKGAMETLREGKPVVYEPDGKGNTFASGTEKDSIWISANYFGKLGENRHLQITWLDGEKTALSDKDLVVSRELLHNFTVFEGMEGEEKLDLDAIAKASLTMINHMDGSEETGFRIVGILEGDFGREGIVLAGDAFVKNHTADDSGIYDHAIGPMPQGRSELTDFVTYINTEQENLQYKLVNPVCYELDLIHEVLQVLSKVFLWIGVFFALFAALLLSNFIGTSISYKKQEIGILRAIGSRGNDVFRIFFSESFLIAATNFLLSSTLTGVITLIINATLRKNTGLLITLLSFGPRQILLMLLISLAIAAIASFVPVKRIAAKRPIDAIRDR